MNATAEEIKGFISYPCHPKERKMVYISGHGRVSDKCPRCGDFATFDLDEMRSWRSEAVKGAVSKQNNRIYRLSH